MSSVFVCCWISVIYLSGELPDKDVSNMDTETPLYELLRQRMKAHAEADYARVLKMAPALPPTQKPIRGPRMESRSSRWYFGFERRYGMTYGQYRRAVRLGQMERIKREPEKPKAVEPAVQTAPKPPVQEN